MATWTGISDRGYLSMENTILNSVCVWECVCVSLCGHVFEFGKCECKKKKKHLRVNICAFCNPLLFFPRLTLSLENVCFGEFFQTEHWQTGGFENIYIYEWFSYVTQSAAHSGSEIQLLNSRNEPRDISNSSGSWLSCYMLFLSGSLQQLGSTV